MSESEFSAEMNVTRISEHAKLAQDLGRQMTDIEKMIFDRGFMDGARFGIRDAGRAFDRIVAAGGK